MAQNSPLFKTIESVDMLNQLVERSKKRPIVFFKHKHSSSLSIRKKSELEKDWTLSDKGIEVFLLDHNKDTSVIESITSVAEVSNEFPQIILFADGISVYDESGEQITVRKLELALNIVSKTFKWMKPDS